MLSKRLAALASALAVVCSLAATTVAGAASRPGPVSPEEAEAIMWELAAKSPPLPPSIAAWVYRDRGPRPPAALLREAHRALERYRTTEQLDEGHHHHDHEWDKNGLSCYAQGFGPDGKLLHHNERDLNGNGRLDPWELNPNRNETCLETILFAYNQEEHDKGSFTFEVRTEHADPKLPWVDASDPEAGRVYERIAMRWNYVVDDHHHHGECQPTQANWDAGMRYLKRAKAELAKYANNPMLAWEDGFQPYPVPATKTFHWFNGDRWADGNTLDPDRVEMFVAALTDDGWVPVNISPIYHYGGNDPAPAEFDPNADPVASRNAGAGCLIEWHRHYEQSAGAEGAATGNTEGRDWMGHLWIYGGLYPFGDSDIDCSEPHGWLTPLNNVPALCNSVGTGI